MRHDGPGSHRAAEFWTERKVAWYQRALRRSDYAEKVLGVIAPVLTGCETALDVGAGCGALTLPLGERLRTVTALEPAPAMAKALREAAQARGLGNVEVIEVAWEAAAAAPHDLVVCAHVGELLHPDAAFLREVSAVARQGVVLVRDAGTERDKFFYRELYPVLLGRSYGSGCDYRETLGALTSLGITPRVDIVGYRSDQPFDDLEEACDFWQTYLDLWDERTRGFLREFLAKRLTREPSGWVAPYPKDAAVMWWPVGAGSAAA